jgi:hypothetical protein
MRIHYWPLQIIHTLFYSLPYKPLWYPWKFVAATDEINMNHYSSVCVCQTLDTISTETLFFRTFCISRLVIDICNNDARSWSARCSHLHFRRRAVCTSHSIATRTTRFRDRDVSHPAIALENQNLFPRGFERSTYTTPNVDVPFFCL